MNTEDKQNKQQLFPYVSYPAFKAFLGYLKATVTPPQIDPTMMPHSVSGGVRAAIISALKSLSLIDAQCNTSQKLKDLVDAYDTNKWQEMLKKYVLSAYTGVIGDMDLKTVTPKQIDGLFADASAEMKEKCVRFFLTVNKEAGIEYSPHLKIRRRGTSKRTSKPAQRGEGSGGQGRQESPPSGEKQTPSSMFDMPIPIASAEKCFIRVPRGITTEQVTLITAAVAFIDAMAKQNKENK